MQPCRLAVHMCCAHVPSSFALLPRLHYRLLTLCPAPTDPVDQSWPRGTGSVGDSVGEDSDSVGEDSHPIAHLARTHKMCDCVRVLDAMLYAQGDAVHAFSLRLGMCLLVCLLCSPYLTT